MNVRAMERRILKAQLKKKGFSKINKHFKDIWHERKDGSK